jgi:D-tagatose-1,6-bisphosphate aldolase subunit GatZ/KbaZ
MSDIKYFIGPMSLNITDAVIDFGETFGLIPSRRQVDHNGGYVNNWTTETFVKHVNGRVVIERDHAGASQGYVDDDGYASLKTDCENNIDIIHIDPWIKYSKYQEGLRECINNIEFCYSVNKHIKFEVATEEAIRKFGVASLNSFLSDLESKLLPEIFSAIEYVAIQSGVGLNLGKRFNTGNFNPKNMEQLIAICKQFGKKSKEHNGDYLSDQGYKARFDLGLDSINIAPEFGQLETLCYLDEMGSEIEDFYQICYRSHRWKKWVSKDFIPEDNKRELIKICGHYVLSDSEFLTIKPDIDDKIAKVIKNKLRSLNDLLGK